MAMSLHAAPRFAKVTTTLGSHSARSANRSEPKMPRSRLKAALALLLTAATILTATSWTAEAAAKPSATVLSAPRTVYTSPDLTHIKVRVTYKCRNTNRVTYYLSGGIFQAAVPDTYYSIGYRNETGIVRAKCTGAKVTQTLKYMRSWWYEGSSEPQPQLQAGPADFSFDLDARGAQGVGAGWYDDKDPDFTVERTVNLVTP
jgi:hypothetical protein